MKLPKLGQRFQAAWRVLRGKATVYRVRFVELENGVQIKAYNDTPNNITGYEIWWEFSSAASKFTFTLGDYQDAGIS